MIALNRPLTGVLAPRKRLPASLQDALDEATKVGHGEVIVETGRGHGLVFVSAGHVAWVVSGSDGDNLSTVLHRREGVDRATLRRVLRSCYEGGGNFGEALVTQGVLNRDEVRAALLEHNAAQLRRLVGRSANPESRFRPKQRRFSSDLLFPLSELLIAAGLSRSDDDLSVASERGDLDPNQEMCVANIKGTLDELMQLDGAIAVAIVDWESGMTLGVAGGGPEFDIELAASGNTQVVKAKMGVMRDLGIDGAIEDILITLGPQYHLIRPLAKNPSLFIYVALDKARGNLGLARHRLRRVEESLSI